MASHPVSVLLGYTHLYQDIYTTILHERKQYCRVKVGGNWGRLRIARGEVKSAATFFKGEGRKEKKLAT